MSKDKEHKKELKHKAKDLAIEDYVVREESFLPAGGQ